MIVSGFWNGHGPRTAEHRYNAAYRALCSAGEQGPLATEDQQLLAEAAWWLGLLHECLRLTEQLHHVDMCCKRPR